MQRRNVYIGIGLAFALFLATYFVYQIRAIVLVLLLTLLFSVLVSGPVDYLARRGVGRGIGTVIVLTALATVLALIGVSMGSVVESQVRGLVEQAPTLLSDVQSQLEQLRAALGLETGFFQPDPQQILDSARNFLSGGTFSTFVSVGASVVNVLSFGVVILIATIYSVARPSPLVNGFVALFPAGRRPRAREILFEMYKSVQRWFLGQLVSMFIIGLLFTISLSIIGVPFALLLGLLSGLLAFVPFVGPLISIIPPILLALVDDPINALWVIAAYGVVQFVEGNIVQPMVMSRAISLHPAVIVFAILIMGTLFGFVGLFFAIPLVAALHVLMIELWIKRMDSLGTDPDPPKEEPEKEETPKQKVGRLRRVAGALSRRS
jgi:predicted PurR-regulated permease PerM